MNRAVGQVSIALLLTTAKPGPFQVTWDRTDAAQGESSFHGAYRFQLRLCVKAKAAASRLGLADLGIVAYFNNGIMSLPRIFTGDNTKRIHPLLVLQRQRIRL